MLRVDAALAAGQVNKEQTHGWRLVVGVETAVGLAFDNCVAASSDGVRSWLLVELDAELHDSVGSRRRLVERGGADVASRLSQLNESPQVAYVLDCVLAQTDHIHLAAGVLAHRKLVVVVAALVVSRQVVQLAIVDFIERGEQRVHGGATLVEQIASREQAHTVAAVSCTTVVVGSACGC